MLVSYEALLINTYINMFSWRNKKNILRIPRVMWL